MYSIVHWLQSVQKQVLTTMTEGVIKDSKYSWLVMASVLYSMFLCGFLTIGSVSVLVYVWSEMFTLNVNHAAWAPAIMGASYQMTGEIRMAKISKHGLNQQLLSLNFNI